jgi:hypothetical protein
MKNVWQKITAPFSGESAGLHKLIAGLAVLALLLAIPVTLTLVQSQQDIRQEAAQRNRNNNNNNYRQNSYDTNKPNESGYNQANNRDRIVPTNPPTGTPQPTFAYVTLKPGEPTPAGAICSGGANNRTCRIEPTPTRYYEYGDGVGGDTYDDCDRGIANMNNCSYNPAAQSQYTQNVCSDAKDCTNILLTQTPIPTTYDGGGSGGSGDGGSGSNNPLCSLFPTLPGCSSNNPTPTGSGGATTPTSPATGTGPTRSFALNLVLHGIGSGGDVVNVGGGNPNPQTIERPVQMQFFDAQNRPAGTATGVVTYDPTSGTYKGTVSLPLQSGAYTALVTTDNYIQSTPRGIIQVQ